jgi:tungstate transport system ATP-binding protein
MSTALYELNDIRQVYGGRTVLSIDELCFEPNAIIGLTGPNGCGKSTLLRILAFLESPAQGSVLFKGAPMSPGDKDIRRRVTMLGQIPFLLKRSVMANVAYGLKVRGSDNVTSLVHQGLEMVGLDPARFASRSWHELSGGETQRVALAARLVLKPEVLLLDEPTASLDSESAELVKSAALQARKQWNTSLVVVSHDHDWLDTITDRTVRLREGRVRTQPPGDRWRDKG